MVNGSNQYSYPITITGFSNMVTEVCKREGISPNVYLEYLVNHWCEILTKVKEKYKIKSDIKVVHFQKVEWFKKTIDALIPTFGIRRTEIVRLCMFLDFYEQFRDEIKGML